MNTSNPLAEIGAMVIAGLLVIGGVVLLATSKIDFVAATVMFGSAVALLGGNLALKAPSPAQQNQLLNLMNQQAVPTVPPPVVINNNIPASAPPPPIESMSTQTSIPAVRTPPAQGG